MKTKRKIGTLSIVSLVTSIMGLLAVPFLFSTAAVITGAVALGKKERFALAGLLMGICGWVYGLIVFMIALNDLQTALAGLGL